VPQIRRRIGTAFTLNDKLLLKPKTKEEEILSKLELEFEIQSKIVSAASKLAKDSTAKKNVRKQRKQAYQQSLAKMKDLEAKLNVVKRQIAASKLAKSRRNRSNEDLSEDNISHSTDESQDKCENSLNKFFVTERNRNENMLMKRSSSLHSASMPSSPAKLNESSSLKLRPLSPSITSFVPLPARVKLIQRPRSAAAKSEPCFDYDTDEESNEALKHTDHDFDNTSSVGSSSGGTNSVIYLGDDKNKSTLMQSPYVNKYETTLNLNEGSNLYSVPNRRTSLALKSQDDTIIKSPNNLNKDLIVRKNHTDLINDNKSLLARSNSLDNSRRRGTTTQRLLNSEDVNNSSHHKHYLNHYPSYRVNRTEMSESAQTCPSVASYHLAQRPLPTPPLPDSKQSNFSSNTANVVHSDCRTHQNNKNSISLERVVVCDVPQIKHFKQTQSSLFNFDNVLDDCSVSINRTVTPSKCAPNNSTESHANQNSSQFLLPPTKAKTWTETSLDFVLPSKLTNNNKQQITFNSNSSLNSQQSVNRPSQQLNTPIVVNCDSPKELHTSIATTASHNTSRNSITSIGKSIGDGINCKPPVIPLSPTISACKGVEVNVVSVGHFQPYWEEEKPYELSDFYKYSKKHRNNAKQMASTPANNTPTSINAQPIRSVHLSPNNSSQDLSHNKCQSKDSSFSLNDSLKTKMCVSESFHNELIAWYDDRDRDQTNHNNNNNNATLV
jgi:hypothetical protein